MSNILHYCSELPVRSYQKGATILKQGSKDGEILFLKSGTVEIKVDDSIITTLSNEGAMLGEIAVLLKRGHSAAVYALKDCEFYVLENADQTLANHPEINQEISTALARRLVRASESIAELTKQIELEDDLDDFKRTMLWDEDENF